MIEKIEKDNVTLQRALCSNPEHMLRIVDWLNDPELMQFSEQRHKKHTLASVIKYRQEFDQNDNLLWDIYQRQKDGNSLEHVGTLTAYIDPPNKMAQMGMLVGKPNQGIGTIAWGMAMTYLKTRVEYILAGTMLNNLAQRKVCEKNGMRTAGFILHQAFWKGHRETMVYFKWELGDENRDPRTGLDRQPPRPEPAGYGA